MSTPLIVLVSVLVVFAIALIFFMMPGSGRSQNQGQKRAQGKQGGTPRKKKNKR